MEKPIIEGIERCVLSMRGYGFENHIHRSYQSYQSLTPFIYDFCARYELLDR